MDDEDTTDEDAQAIQALTGTLIRFLEKHDQEDHVKVGALCMAIGAYAKVNLEMSYHEVVERFKEVCAKVFDDEVS